MVTKFRENDLKNNITSYNAINYASTNQDVIPNNSNLFGDRYLLHVNIFFQTKVFDGWTVLTIVFGYSYKRFCDSNGSFFFPHHDL